MTRRLDVGLMVAILGSFAWNGGQVRADARLPSVFGSRMVLQRDADVPIWGWADPGERVLVAFQNQVVTTHADADGNWKVSLAPLKVAGSETLTVKANNVITLDDVLVGEVWVCSGQSNMQWAVSQAIDPDLEAAAADYPDVRLFQVVRETAAEPLDELQTRIEWQACSPETISSFSAVSYYFGRQLHQVLGVPIGLIHTSWGGTRAEAWTSPEAMAATEELKPILDTWKQRCAAYQADTSSANADPRLDRHHPSNLYNAMISPLVGYSIRGAIWYQGESNASRAYQYRTLMPTMIQSWRDAWGQGDFSFYQVQLANFRAIKNEPGESDWAELREAQYLATQRLPHVGAACITDLGAILDIHPKDKQNVGKRLARLALHHDYGMTDLVKQGPTYSDLEVKDGKCMVRFETSSSQLITRYRQPLTGFAICGSDRNWVWGNAKIVGKDTVEVSHPDISEPVAVRYNWADNPQGNLYNALYLPAYPFRTDDWKGITADSVTP